MPLKNLLSLYEAIVVTLISQPLRTGSLNELANIIEKRNLYPIREAGHSLEDQIKLCTSNSNAQYSHLFKEIGAGYIALRNSYADFAIQLDCALDDILDYDNKYFNTIADKLDVIDIEARENKKMAFSPNKLIYISTKQIKNKKTGRKKFILYLELDNNNKEIIKEYSIQMNQKQLLKKIDPLQNYLAIVSKQAIINVRYFKLSEDKKLMPDVPEGISIKRPTFQFSESKTAKQYKQTFELIQRHYREHISLQNKIQNYKRDLDT